METLNRVRILLCFSLKRSIQQSIYWMQTIQLEDYSSLSITAYKICIILSIIGYFNFWYFHLNFNSAKWTTFLNCLSCCSLCMQDMTKTKQNKTKQNKTWQTKQNKTKQNMTNKTTKNKTTPPPPKKKSKSSSIKTMSCEVLINYHITSCRLKSSLAL